MTHKFKTLPKIQVLQLVNNMNRVLNNKAILDYNNSLIKSEQLFIINDSFKDSKLALDMFLKDYES